MPRIVRTSTLSVKNKGPIASFIRNFYFVYLRMKYFALITFLLSSVFGITGYLYMSNVSDCQDECSQYTIHYESLDIEPVNIKFQNSQEDIDLYLNRYVEVSLGNEILCTECTAYEVENISLSNNCEYINDCLRAGLVYRREFYNDSELEAENSIFFKITLTPFGNMITPLLSFTSIDS